MYFADQIAGPDAPKEQARLVIPDVVTTSLKTGALIAAPTPEPVVETVVLASLEVANDATVFEPKRAPASHEAGARFVPFMRPTVVNADGRIAEPLVEPVAAAVAVEVTVPAADPVLEVRYVSAKRVNVRQGPSTDQPVLGKVVFAEAVQVMSDPTEEWVMIRIEGDGIEGYMASRFLQRTDPQG